MSWEHGAHPQLSPIGLASSASHTSPGTSLCSNTPRPPSTESGRCIQASLVPRSGIRLPPSCGSHDAAFFWFTPSVLLGDCPLCC